MNPLLLEGLADELGFVGGALVGFLLARLAGFDLFAEGYGASSMAAIVAVGIGAGLGRAVTRRWRLRREAARRAASAPSSKS